MVSETIRVAQLIAKVLMSCFSKFELGVQYTVCHGTNDRPVERPKEFMLRLRKLGKVDGR